MNTWHGSGDGRELAVGGGTGPERLGGPSAGRAVAAHGHRLLLGLGDSSIDGEFLLSPAFLVSIPEAIRALKALTPLTR